MVVGVNLIVIGVIKMRMIHSIVGLYNIVEPLSNRVCETYQSKDKTCFDDDHSVSGLPMCLVCKAKEIMEEMKEEDNSDLFRNRLLNLLAVIHRDGGHRTKLIGIEESLSEAHKIVANLLVK